MTRILEAFRCIQPDLMVAYQEMRNAEFTIFQEKIEEFKRMVGGRELHGILRHDGVLFPEGYILRTKSEAPLPGWRQVGSSNRAVPAKRTPEGRAMDEAFLKFIDDDAIPSLQKFPGFPSVLHSGYYIVAFPEVDKYGDDFILTLTIYVDSEERTQIDTTIWEPMKLSQYRAILEESNS
jgi:hypothetical protein